MTGGRDFPSPPDDVIIERATPDDRLDLLRILDAAMLETDADTVDERIAAGDAFVARSTRTGGVVGALVATRPDADRLHVDAVAVRQVRRGEGIGSALVAAAVDRGASDPAIETVSARFDADLRAFYEALGFRVRSEQAARDSTVDPTDDASDGNPTRLDGRVSVDGRDSA